MASRFERLLLTSVLAVVRRPRLTLGVAAAVLVACVVLAKARLPMSADQNKLFSADVPFFKDYLRFVELFPENEAIYLILEARDPAAPPPPITRWTAAAEAVAARLRQLPHAVKSVDQRVPIDALGDQGLLFDDAEGVRQTIEQARPFVPLVKLWAEESNLATRLLGRVPIDRFLGALALRASDAEAGAFVARLAESWNKTLSNPPPAASQAGDSRSATPQAADVVVPDLESLDPPTSPGRLGYYWVADETDPARQRHLLLVRVYPNVDYRDPNSLSDAFDAIRGAARDEVAKFPEFTIGASGRPALEAEEMRTTDRDATRSEILALSLVFVGLVVTLRSLWLAAVAEVALAVAIGWTFGWAAVSVGELNLLSMVFLIALIGIGMDYLVQILTRYVQELARHGRDRAEGIWLRVFKHVGPPINTACAGAAGAFLVSALTDFKGAADLGVIAGGGLLLCLVSGYTVLPALLTVFPPTRLINAMMEDGSRRRNLSLGEDPDRTWDGAPDPGLRQGSGAGVLSASVRGRRSLALPLVWGALLVVATPFMFRARFDPGLLELQAQNLESVQLVRKLSTWSAVVLSTDLDTLRAARAALAEADTVAGTDSILNAHDNAAWLAAGPNRLPDIDWSAPAAVAAGDVPRIANKARVLAGRFA
ncbi:MAG TPA: MMPL family transporter, partial [Tepidisphaeraceae bacterium]|nr:MMPL family transporter [Tepidisphaeraceae bacterium]